MPNIGQIVEIDPDQMNAAQAVTTSARSDDRARQPVWFFKFAIEAPAKLAHQKTGHARAGVDRSEDEQRFKHDREVIPVLHQPAQTGNAVEDLRDAERQRDGAAGSPAQIFLA